MLKTMSKYTDPQTNIFFGDHDFTIKNLEFKISCDHKTLSILTTYITNVGWYMYMSI